MLRQPQNNHSRDTGHTLLFTPPPSAPSSSSTQPSTLASNVPRFQITQLNCFNKQDTTQELLQLADIDILLLQEPWTNPFTHKIASHKMWHDITPYNHITIDTHTKFRTCIHVAQKLMIQNILVLPSGNTFITALELTTKDTTIPKIE